MARPWYPRYPDDYARKTPHLSFAEHGAYTLLMDQYYRTGEPLSGDSEILFRICRGRGRAERQALENVLVQFFEQRDGRFRNARSDEEITRAQEIHEKRVKGGKCSAHARTHAEHKGAVRARTSQPQSQLQEDRNTEPSLEFVGSASAKPKKGTRWESSRIIEKDWILLGNAARNRHGLPRIDLELEAEQFAAYWTSKAGSNATKLDWHRTWIAWALKAEGKRNGSGHPRLPSRTASAIAKLGAEFESLRPEIPEG